jgi:hypothetical protein
VLKLQNPAGSAKAGGDTVEPIDRPQRGDPDLQRRRAVGQRPHPAELFGHRQPPVQLSRVLGGQRDPGRHQDQDRVVHDCCRGQRVQPGPHGREPPAVDIADPVSGDELADLGEVAGGGGVADGVGQEAGLLVPGAGAPVRLGNQRRL